MLAPDPGCSACRSAPALGGMLGMASSIFIVLAAATFVAALLYKRFRHRRPRDTALSVVSGPGTGNSARHHHLDGGIDHRGSRAVAGDSAMAAAAPDARQSCWVADRSRRFSFCRSDPGAGGRRGDDLWLRHTDGGLAPPVASTRPGDRKSTRLNSSHVEISYAVFCLKKKKNNMFGLQFQKKKEIKVT